MTDPELRKLLIEELRRHADTLSRGTEGTDELRSVLHAVKGTAGVAGELALSDVFARLERRTERVDTIRHALEALERAIRNLEADEPALVDPWPVPPPLLEATTPSSVLNAQYEEDMRDRIAALDDIVASDADPCERLSHAMRHVHAMKGAAAAVGDEATTWFCHGLESRIRSAGDNAATCASMIEQLAAWRPVLTGLVDDPTGTLEVLRAADSEAGVSGPDDEPGSVTTRPEDEAFLHVPAHVLDLVIERLRRVTQSARDMHEQGEGVRRAARSLRWARQQLLESRRMIGPPRPWGAPVAALDALENATNTVGSAALQLESLAAGARRNARSIGRSATTSHHELGTVRRATMDLVFDRVRTAVDSFAERSGTEVRVNVTGGSTPVDRRLAESLVDPVLQLARNAVAHGIEAPSLRLSLGKPRWGSILLSAEVRGAHLLVGVRDDGGGVDVDSLRAEAIRSGRLSRESAHEVADEALLNLLFSPGVTTRTTADVLAGRGLGLDMSLHAAKRMGGTIRIRNRPGRGLTAVVDVPLVERGQAQVLWARSLEHRFALTARYVQRARVRETGELSPPPLATWIDCCLHGREDGFVLEIGRDTTEVVTVAVAAIEGIEEATVRPVPPLVALAGPFVGVIVDADGRPALLIDAMLVADRATRSHATRASSFPPPARSKDS